jgi:hypothetical protein
MFTLCMSLNLLCFCVFIKYLHILKGEDTVAENYENTAVDSVTMWKHIVPQKLSLMTQNLTLDEQHHWFYINFYQNMISEKNTN